MKFYVPDFEIATLSGPQDLFRSKFGGLPWGLPLERWCRCQQCGKLMSLLAQLSHDPPALDLGGPEHVLHLFQCQECYGIDPGEGNDAIMVRVEELGYGITELPANENLAGVLGPGMDQMVGELWIAGWKELDDGFDPRLATELYDQETWMQLPESVTHAMFENRWRTKMGGIPYWTGNGPLHKPSQGYEFLFQLDTVEFEGTPPAPNEIGGMVVVTELAGEGSELRIVRQDYREPDLGRKQRNAPWHVDVDVSRSERFLASITNLGSDGTAYVFINRESIPAHVYWLWNR